MQTYVIILASIVIFSGMCLVGCQPQAATDIVADPNTTAETIEQLTSPAPTQTAPEVTAETPSEAPTQAATAPEPTNQPETPSEMTAQATTAPEPTDQPTLTPEPDTTPDVESTTASVPTEPNTSAQQPQEPAVEKIDIEIAAPNRPVETAAQPVKPGVAATVNGADIAFSDIEAAIEPELERMAAQASKMPPQFLAQYKARLRQQALDRMIIEQLLEEQIKIANIIITDEDVAEQLGEIASKQQMSVDQFKTMLASRGRDFDLLSQQIKRGLTYQRLFETQFADEINFTEEDAQKYYSENQKQFETPEQVRASHILIVPDDTSDPNIDPNQAKEAAKAKAQSLREQVLNGADFATLARANSDGPSAPRGGDLNFGKKSDPESGRRGTWVEPFEKAAFALELGQVSNVVETQYGYHIIKVTGRKDATTTTFQQAKDDIIEMLKQQKQRELTNQYIESLKAAADIVYYPAEDQQKQP